MIDPFRPYRKAFRAWRSLRRLEREREHYHREFVRRGLSVPDPDAIARAVEVRRPGLAPVARGGLRTLAIFHDYNWERTALLPALAEFGEVVHYDWRGNGLSTSSSRIYPENSRPPKRCGSLPTSALRWSILR